MAHIEFSNLEADFAIMSEHVGRIKYGDKDH